MKNLNWEELAFEFQLTNISLTKMSKRENVDRRTLSKHFKDLGIKIINKQNRVKFDNHVFDNIDTEEKAYWLGFIFVDGNIKNVSKSSAYTFEISLKGLDINHLYKFNSFMKHEKNNIKLSKSKCKGKIFERCRWIVSDKHLWNTLNNLGCTPKKSLTLEFPKNIKFKLIRHFIRGYFDGNGCITRYVYINTVSPRIEIIGTYNFLNAIKDIINIECKFRHDKRHSDKTYILEFNKESGIKFINYIYDDSSIYLDRKYKLYNFFKKGSRSTKEFIELSSGNIGENPIKENPEINLESKKSESSYSIESETI